MGCRCWMWSRVAEVLLTLVFVAVVHSVHAYRCPIWMDHLVHCSMANEQFVVDLPKLVVRSMTWKYFQTATHLSVNPPAVKWVPAHHHHHIYFLHWHFKHVEHRQHPMLPAMPCKHSQLDSRPNCFPRVTWWLCPGLRCWALPTSSWRPCPSFHHYPAMVLPF